MAKSIKNKKKEIPLIGELFRGLEKLVDLAKRVEEKGGEIKEVRKIEGKNGETKGIFGISIKTGLCGESKTKRRKKVKMKVLK